MSVKPPSDTFCALPFMAVDCHHKVRKPCCHSQDSSWASYHTLQEYWASDTLRRVRDNLLQGIKDPSCKKCWQTEHMGQKSMRQSVNQSRADMLDYTVPMIRQVKIITGKTCNLACMMCFDTISSTYQDLWKSDKTWIMPTAKQRELEYDDEMDLYIRQHADSLQYIEALGGEPLFNKKYIELIEYLIEIGANRHLTLFVVTNGTLITPKIVELFGKFKKTVFAVSVDGIGSVNDYQRWPSRWSEIEKNLAIINENFDMCILPTITALNIISLPRLIDYCQEKNYVVGNLTLVDHWSEILPSNLPQELKSLVDDRYKPLLEGPSDTSKLLGFIQKWDKMRNISIVDYMPEWRNFKIDQANHGTMHVGCFQKQTD